MSRKKESIDEKLSQSIFYNLSILKRAAKTTADFEEVLSNVIWILVSEKFILINSCPFQTMFLKSNTRAFIHITHYLFNIIDPKHLKSKFYWPICEKKAENAYR